MGTHEHDRNPTQERLDEEGTDDRPVDVDWEPETEKEGSNDE
jgi:hypothetical protein